LEIIIAFIGVASGKSNIDGYSNSFIGPFTGTSNSSGYRNSFLGKESGWSNTSGNSNTFIGTYSGFTNQTGSNNVVIGYGAGPSNLNSDASNRLYIDVIPNECGFLTGNDTPLIYGEFDNDLLRINGTLHITETAKLTPLIIPPTCTSTEEGLIYFNANNRTLQVCKGSLGWKEVLTN